MQKTKLFLAVAGICFAGIVSGCDSGTVGGADPRVAPTHNSDSTPSSARVIQGDPPKEAPEPVELTQGKVVGGTGAPGVTEPKVGEEVAVMTTTQGTIVLKFFPKIAPKHVENFKTLAKKGFYDGTKFHRVIPGFMIQGGDPYSKTGEGPVGTGGPGYSIKAEFNSMKHKRGILSMARSNDPDSAGSQFFIMVADSPQLDNQYSAFGQVVSGMNVADAIVSLPRDGSDKPTGPEAVITSLKIEKWPLKGK